MSDVRTLHQTAMEHADRADRLRAKGDFEQATEAIRAAYIAEERAAMLLAARTDAEPSRAILFRSAATLAIEAEEFRAAERLACVGMTGSPANELLDELREVYERAQFRRHLETRGIVLDPQQVQMSLAGSAIAPAMAESNEFTDRVHATEKLMIRTYERKANLPYREVGNIANATRERVALYLSVPRGGSFTVTFQIGGPQLHLFSSPSEVIDEVMACFDLWQRNDEDGLRRRIPDESYRRNFVGLVGQIAPDGERVRQVGFTTTRGGRDRAVELTRRVPKAEPRGKGKRPKVLTVTGVLRFTDSRSSDVSRHKMILVQEDGTEFAFRVLAGHGDVVRAHYEQYVSVTVEKAAPRTGGGYLFRAIERAAPTGPPP